MIRKFLFACAILALFSCHQANAAIIGLTQTELMGMSIDSSSLLTAVNSTALTMGPGAGAYDDGSFDVETMNGVAGSNELLGDGGYVRYALSAPDLAALNAASSAGDTFKMKAYNDNNNDFWNLGVWYRDATGTYESTGLVNAGSSAIFSIVIPDTVTAAGVMVKVYGANDQFHASWQLVPEPGTIAIWTTLGGLAFVGFARRRRAVGPPPIS